MEANATGASGVAHCQTISPPAGGIKESVALVRTVKVGENITAATMNTRARINEQEFFAAVIHSRLTEKGAQLGDLFKSRLEQVVANLQEKGSDNLFLRATRRALRQLVKAGELVRSEAREVRQFSLGKAQLDSHRDQLSLSRLDDTPGETPVRSISTALARFGENVAATEQDFNSFKQHNRRVLRQGGN